jgi:hypothetical protein
MSPDENTIAKEYPRCDARGQSYNATAAALSAVEPNYVSIHGLAAAHQPKHHDDAPGRDWGSASGPASDRRIWTRLVQIGYLLGFVAENKKFHS